MTIDRAPHTIVTLVHGTFARDAPWTHPDSKLSVALRTALDGGTLIESFDWSGRNSHAARAVAARDLVERLRDRIAAHPDAVHHIVAHSHGGNVAMHALRRPDLQSRVSSVVCLGTPFIHAEPRALEATLQTVRLGALCGLGFSAAAFVLVGLWSFSGYVLRALPANLHYLLLDLRMSSLGTIAWQLALACAWIAAGLVLVWMAPRAVRLVNGPLNAALAARQSRILATLAMPEVRRARVLVVLTLRDEALGYLRVVQAIAELPYRLWTPRLGFLLVFGMYAAVGLAVAWAVVDIILAVSVPPLLSARATWDVVMLGIISRTAFTVMSVSLVGRALFEYLSYGALALGAVVALSQLVLLLLPILFRQHALGFGERNAFENWLVDIRAERLPRNVASPRVVEVAVEGRGLRHSMLYDDDAVVCDVVAWIGEAARARLDPPVAGYLCVTPFE